MVLAMLLLMYSMLFMAGLGCYIFTSKKTHLLPLDAKNDINL